MRVSHRVAVSVAGVLLAVSVGSHSARAGIGQITVTPEGFDYPDAIVGAPIQGSITIGNTGPAATVSAVGISGTNAVDVTIGAETCTAAPIPQDGSCVIPFTYRALEQGNRTAFINVSGPDPVGEIKVLITAHAELAPSGVSWGTRSNAGPAYTWNGGNALGRTVQDGTQRLHLAYATDRIGGNWATNSGPKVGVYYVRSTSGTTWGTPVRLNPSSQHSTTLGLTAAGKKVYAIWVSQTKWTNYNPTAPRQLFVRVNKKHGASGEWRSAKSLSSATGRVDYPTIAATGSDAHIAYTNAVNGNVYVQSSRDGGSTWTRSTVGGTSISFTDGRTGFATISASGSTVVVCWLSDTFGTVKCRVSANRGVSWGSTTIVGEQSIGYFSVAARGSRIVVAWITPADIVFAQRTGGTWTAPQVIPTDHTANELYGPQVSLQDPNRIGVAWSAEYGFETRLRWTESANGGAVWQVASEVSTASSTRARNDWPSVVWSSPGTRYVAWNGWTEFTTNYRLSIRAGTGTSTSVSAAATPWAATEPIATVRGPATMHPRAVLP